MSDPPPSEAPDFFVAAIAAQVHAALFGSDDAPAMLGRFRVIRPLGSGAMGTVWLARDDELDREVAIKLLRPITDDEESRARLLGEARSLARLAHPNVVVVHEVGVTPHGGFVAMEYVRGTTLTQWQRETSRAVAEIVEMYLQIGAGLAAAHEVGVVHRDFKPDNVLVGDDGRPRVADFGLARGETSALAQLGPGSTLATQAGTILGTPAYMAPEQLAGRPSDARADQFAFAVALYEALVGERPFAGDNVETLRTAQTRAPGASPRIGRALRRVIDRALAPNPAARFTDMPALLEALASTRRSALRRWGPPLLVVGVSAAWLASRGGDDRCRSAGDELARVWDPSTRARIAERFTSAEMPFAAASWSTTATALDAAASRLIDTARSACAAADVRDDEDLRTASATCLDQHESELAQVIAAIDGSPSSLAAAPHRAVALPDASACADPRRVRLLGSSDGLGEAVAALARARAIQAELAFGRVDGFRARSSDALADARAAASAAESAGAPLVAAGARTLEAKLLARRGDVVASEAAAARAIEHATVLDDPIVRVVAMLQLVYAIGTDHTRRSEALAVAEQADALLAATGQQPLLRAQLDNNLGLVLARAEGSDRDRAIDHHRRAIAGFERSLGAAHPDTIAARVNLGSALARLDRVDAALAELEPAVPLALAVWGEDHPSSARLFGVIGNAWLRRGAAAEAETWLRRALASAEHSAPEDVEVANALYNLAMLLRRRMVEPAPGSATTPDPVATEAVALLRRALAIREAIEGELSMNLVAYLVALGEAEIAAGELRRAEDDLRRALRGCERDGASAVDFARVRLALARAVVDRDRREAAVLAGDARRAFVEADRPEQVAACDRVIALAGG